MRIDVDQLLLDRELELVNPSKEARSGDMDKDGKPRLSRKRKSKTQVGGGSDTPKAKRPKIKAESSKAGGSGPLTKAPMTGKMTVTLKLGPRPAEPEAFPCCLCVGMGQDGLLRVHDPPIRGAAFGTGAVDGTQEGKWMAHEECANVVPETWVDEIDVPSNGAWEKGKERVVFGVDGIVKDRWNLVRVGFLCMRLRVMGVFFADLQSYET